MLRFKKSSEVVKPFQVFKPKSITLKELSTFLSVNLDEKFAISASENDLEIITKVKKKKEAIISYKRYDVSEHDTHFNIRLTEVDKKEESKKELQLGDDDTIVTQTLQFANSQLDVLESFKYENPFISVEKLTLINSVLHVVSTEEFIFAVLPIDNLKTERISVEKSHDYFLLITSSRKLVLALPDANSQHIDLSHETLAYKAKTGKDYISNATISFSTEFFNDSLFEELSVFITQKAPYSTANLGDIRYNRSKLKASEIPQIKHIYNTALSQTSSLNSALKVNLIDAFEKKTFHEDQLDTSHFFDLVNSATFKDDINHVFKDWQTDIEEQQKFLNVLLASKHKFKLPIVAPLYQTIFEAKSNTKKELDLAYQVNYAKFLKEAHLYKAAIPQYETIIDNLKNQTVLEMLSDNKTDILNSTDANGLQIKLLEDLMEIKSLIDVNYDEELLKLAKLQPLDFNRIIALKQIDDATILEKTDVILAILRGLDFSIQYNDYKHISNTISKEEIFQKIVPTSYENAKGIFDSITSLIAQITPPDYKSVTDFSEKIISDTHPETLKIVDNVAQTLSIENVEYYLGRGNFSKAIIGVEGKPHFLIIGYDYINSSSEFKMSNTELQFAVAVELSHILFEHTRITSQDVWRGAKNKSMSLAQVLLIALPALGTISGLIGRFVDISKFKNILTGVDTVSDTIDKGQTVLDYGSKMTDFISKDNNKERNLLATSRLLEIAADRVGLLITNDLTQSITAIFKLDEDYQTIEKDIIEKGLYQFLNTKNEDDEFLHQNYIIRLKTLFSFYLENRLEI